jgi:formylglycine-generating enzyme required for sulfatase activity
MHELETVSTERSSARERVERARKLSDRLLAQVRPEAWLDRPIPERHRLIFYLGHLEAFDWNLVGREAGRTVDPGLDRLFAFGIDPPPGRLPQDAPGDWPEVLRVREYVRQARARVDEALAHAPGATVDMAVEHRLMHVETLTYLLHALPYERRIVLPVQSGAPRPAPDRRQAEIPAGVATLGRRRGAGFGWDNELDVHQVHVDAFAVDAHKVTNGRYLEFVEQGGEPSPFWIRASDGWRWRGYDAEIPLPLDRPVYVTQEQAEAFARWAGGVLPTEAQFHRYAFGAPGGDERADSWGDATPSPARDTIAVDVRHPGDSALGVAQAVGNGWEWTRTPFAPFAGFAADPAYPGYSADFFDGRHFVLKGASVATDRALVRRSFRNWFRPGYRHAYTTFRVVEE